MYVNNDFDTIAKLVRKILEEQVSTRSDDIKLYIECCKAIGIITFDDLYKYGLNFETVRRNRQRIQNEKGMYKPSDEVTRARKRKERVWRNKILKISEAE